MPDPLNVAVEDNDDLNAVAKAEIIERHEAHNHEKQAAKEAAEAEKEEKLKEEYKDVTGHDPIEPLSF